jgi:hypothetical protein
MQRPSGKLLIGVVCASCYSTQAGVEPPTDRLYFPTGVAVSADGNRLYAVNSNFDLQYDGATLQVFDLALLRLAANAQAAAASGPCVSGLVGGLGLRAGPIIGDPCFAPSSVFVRNHRLVGAFATDLLIQQQGPNARLFMPVRGNASVTWVDTPNTGEPFALNCGGGVRCDGAHLAGTNPDEPGNSRRITLPGEPFGASFSSDSRWLGITHQTGTQTSLLATGSASAPPSLQFVIDEIPAGGTSITAVPHDPDAFADGIAPRPAFLQTSRSSAQIALLRLFSDDTQAANSSLARPFLVRENVIPVTGNASGRDSRGVVIDASPRTECKARIGSGKTPAELALAKRQCARKPARLFIANRSPASLLIGEVGDALSSDTERYNADSVRILESIPLTSGPSRLFLAPIVDRDGRYAMRVFITCFDSATLFIYDPDARAIESTVRVGLGPFSMSFDPFNVEGAAAHDEVPQKTLSATFNGQTANFTERAYRYAYLASFTTSTVQVIDLDRSRADSQTFERIVVGLGEPQLPKGSN